MKLFIRSTRNGSDYYSQHEGMDINVVTALLTELGCTDITEITEQEWNDGVAGV